MIRMLFISTVLVLAGGCNPGEGERCNPQQFSNDCNSGFACTYPQGCSVAYCCPTTRASSNANCQICPTDDAGAAVQDAATSD